MKALSFKIPKTKDESVRVQVDHQPYFYDSFHYHPEVQISYIFKGSGTRIIGNSVGRFGNSELYVIGSNIPHIFKSDRTFYEENSEFSHAISIYFTEDAIGRDFFNLPEIKEINNLLVASKKIVCFEREATINIKDEFLEITNSKGFDKLHLFLQILNKVSRMKNRKLLSKTTYEHRILEKYGKRINDIFDFVINNYEKSISLDKAAEIANLSTTVGNLGRP